LRFFQREARIPPVRAQDPAVAQLLREHDQRGVGQIHGQIGVCLTTTKPVKPLRE
jgi:hypothetical protein